MRTYPIIKTTFLSKQETPVRATKLLPDNLPFVQEGKPIKLQTAEEKKRDLLNRLEIGKDGNALFLPHVGEFGHRVMTAMRIVHFNKARVKVVCCRDGEQVLYPTAKRFVTDWPDPIPDNVRGGPGEAFRWPQIEKRFPGFAVVDTGGLDFDQELICINASQRVPMFPLRRGLKTDVCLGIRNREFCPEKNWLYWDRLAQAIRNAGFTFSVLGVRPTTLDLEGQSVHSSDYDTDAVVELIMNCRLYLGTDTGISHLAATIGADMIVWREESPHNRDLRPEMEKRNPYGVKMLRDGCWSDPDYVINEALVTLHAKT